VSLGAHAARQTAQLAGDIDPAALARAVAQMQQQVHALLAMGRGGQEAQLPLSRQQDSAAAGSQAVQEGLATLVAAALLGVLTQHRISIGSASRCPSTPCWWAAGGG
jgi:hypothetical protein